MMRLPMLALAACAAAGIAGETQQSPPQAPQVFRGGVRTVPVYATVSDGAGGFAVDLTRDDFELRDNGTVQTITQFTTAAQPLSVVLLLDGSSSMAASLSIVLDAANSFIVRMLPGDRTAIASFSDRFQMRQPFTSDRDELLKHLENQFNIRMGLETRLFDALHEGVLALSRENGRRVVVLVSDGRNWVAPPAGATGLFAPRAGNDFRTRQSAGSLAIARDVMIYAVGMWTRVEQSSEAPDPTIARLAETTGGGYFELRESSDVNSTFTRIMTELHTQYVLGFTPQTLDNKVHTLELRVKRPGTHVRARRSYLASPN